MRWRKIKNILKLQKIYLDPILGHNETQKMPHLHKEYTLMQIQVNIIELTSDKNHMKVF